MSKENNSQNNNTKWLQLPSSIKIGDVIFIGNDELWLTENNGKNIAISNICPHKLGPISVGDRKGDIVTCPWHGYKFNISSGKCINRKIIGLPKYELKTENDSIYIRK